VLEMWYPGQKGAEATTALLYGDVNPQGKLTQTFPVDEAHTLVSGGAGLYPGQDGQGKYTEGVDIGYKWFDKKGLTPLFPFGFGLSYTTFAYSELLLSKHDVAASAELRVEVSVEVTNSGARASDEVVQLYVRDLEASTVVPHHELRGMQRLHLAAGESRRVAFTLDATALSLIDDEGQRRLEPGAFRLFVGGSQPDARSIVLMGRAPLAAELRVTGEPLALPY